VKSFFNIAGNGLQAWEVADASELSSFGKIKVFRENRAEVGEIKAIYYACC